MTTQPLKDDTDSAELATTKPARPASEAGWPELEQLVESIKTKRAEEQAAQEAQRLAQEKSKRDAERAWENLQAQKSLNELAAGLQMLGVVAQQVEGISGSHSATLELSRLAKGETAKIHIDTAGTRNGPRTTVQVQRGSQQLPAQIIGSNTANELRKTLVDVAQKLLG